MTADIRAPATIREHLREHAYPAIISMSVALVAAVLLAYDRRTPFEYVSTTIRPSSVVAGDTIVVQRHVIWHRQCEGVAFTEIVSNDRIITTYDTGVRYPFALGESYADRSISLPLSIRPGAATYRGVIKFSTCGLTSRVVPLSKSYQEVPFEIR